MQDNVVDPLVLIACDDPGRLYEWAKALTRSHLRFREARTGRDVREAVVSDPPDLVLLDARLSDASGLDVCRRLKSERATTKIPVIIISAAPLSPETRTRQLDHADLCLVEPVDLDELVLWIRLLFRVFRAETRADQACVRAETAQREADSRGREAAVLAHVTRGLAESLDLLTIGERIVSGACSLSCVDYAVLRLLREDGALVAFAVSDTARNFVDPGHAIPAGMGILARVVSGGSSVWTPDIQAEPGIVRNDDMSRRLQASAIRGLLAIPLKARGQVIGTFDIADRTSRVFLPREVTLLETFADQAALTLENARRYADTDRCRRQAELAKESAEAANRVKDDFLATLAHELRTPLSAILSWVRALRSGRLPSQRAASALEGIERSAVMQVGLVEQLLDVTRIITGKLNLAKREVDLVDVVDQAVATVNPSADAKAIRVDRTVDTFVPRVFGDPLRLHQIFVNLLSNAIKFSPDGGRVTVRFEVDGGVIKVTVADEGCGIEPEFLPHVFTAYTQAKEERSRASGGLGLGLSIVERLVALHAGAIRAESAGRDQGAAFTVELPALAVRSGLDGADRIQASAPPIEAQRRLDRLCVLVVDDSEDARVLLRTVLKRAGAEVLLAASAAEALQLTADQPLDVLVSDIHMPARSGIDFMTDFRAWEVLNQRSPIPGIALTADERSATREVALQAGFDLCLLKPVDPYVLIDAVTMVCRAARRGRSTPTAGE